MASASTHAHTQDYAEQTDIPPCMRELIFFNQHKIIFTILKYKKLQFNPVFLWTELTEIEKFIIEINSSLKRIRTHDDVLLLYNEIKNILSVTLFSLYLNFSDYEKEQILFNNLNIIECFTKIKKNIFQIKNVQRIMNCLSTKIKQIREEYPDIVFDLSMNTHLFHQAVEFVGIM